MGAFMGAFMVHSWDMHGGAKDFTSKFKELRRILPSRIAPMASLVQPERGSRWSSLSAGKRFWIFRATVRLLHAFQEQKADIFG